MIEEGADLAAHPTTNPSEDLARIAPEISSRFIRLAEQLLTDRPFLCDIGSRDALEGIFLMRRLNGKTLDVFEPNSIAARKCRDNLAGFTRGTHNAVFNEVAVTDAVGTAKFFPINTSRSENKDIGFSSLYRINPQYTKRRGQVVQDEIVVNTITLDSYFLGKERPDVLWLDVEGAELQVLRGASALLRGVTLISWSIVPAHAGWKAAVLGHSPLSG